MIQVLDRIPPINVIPLKLPKLFGFNGKLLSLRTYENLSVELEDPLILEVYNENNLSCLKEICTCGIQWK